MKRFISILVLAIVGVVAYAQDDPIDVSVIPGVTPPAGGATPVTTITETVQYTGTVTWNPLVSTTFAYATTYTATITLTPKAGFTLTGVAANYFTVSGAVATNAADDNILRQYFLRRHRRH